jgi:tetratricopeptide (TPR) repeat protein
MDQYRRAFRMLADHPASRQAMELLCDCVVRDPGNLIFVETFLASLKRGRQPSSPFRGVMLRVRCLLALDKEDWDTVLQTGPRLVLLRPNDAPVLSGLATACQQRAFDDVALRYWTEASELRPDDVPLQRRAGIAFGEQGRFGQALQCWHRVYQQAPTDRQASQLVAIYESLQAMPEENDTAPAAVADSPEPGVYVRRARQHAEAGRPQQALQLIETALTISPGDLQLREQLHEYQLLAAEQKFRAAERQAQCLQTEAASELAHRLEEDWRRQELDMAFDAHLRQPGNVDRRLHLARLLKQHGQFEQAVGLLENPPERLANSPLEQIEIGECLQHLRRFDEALQRYRLAAGTAANANDHAARLARWRAGSLALALGDAKSAATTLAELVALDPEFPGAADKLSEARQLLRDA